MLSVARAEDEMRAKEEELEAAKEQSKKDAEARKKMEEELTEAMSQKEKLYASLQAETDRLIATEDKLLSIQAIKVCLLFCFR